jgi:phosphonatase-like hydrolase
MEEAAVKLTRRNSLKALTAAVALPASTRAADTGIQLVVLDVGGTIIEDRGDVVATMQSTMAERGIVVSAAEIGPWRGASKRSVIQHFVDLRSKKSDADRQMLANAIYQDFNAQLNEAYRAVPPIAGAEEAIRKLRENGYLVAATTGFDREIVLPIFHRLGWEKYFAAVVASNDVSRGRPSPYMLFHAMETAQMDSVGAVMAVGDTPLDLQAASNAGLHGIVGVLSGAGTEEQLRREPHTHLIPSVAGLPALLGPKH